MLVVHHGVVDPVFSNREINTILAYLVGASLGDGNLSCLNRRSTRLRISCDTKYPNLINYLVKKIRLLLPRNRASVVKKEGRCIDVSSYSNHWEAWLGWTAHNGSKHVQNVGVPDWIKIDQSYSIECLRGLFQTDGSIYIDRGYTMVNFVSIIPRLARDVFSMTRQLGFTTHMYAIRGAKNTRYNIRISKNVAEFIRTIHFWKN
jgi:DNA-binding transcriptional regulator WhiA